MLEWPARIPKPRTTSIPCNTYDIYPTLLEIAGVRMKNQPPLDGISLTRLIEGKMTARPKPMGFWDYPISGIATPSAKWMSELLDEQNAGKEPQDVSRLFPDAGKITKQYPQDSFPGHAAWLDWPWKLHRIQDKRDKVRLELYNLAQDPGEQQDLSSREPGRVKSMKSKLEAWLASVVDSLNGKDYH
jgi:arylsulfatase A-like enzyme